jgi:hypothetical protein
MLFICADTHCLFLSLRWVTEDGNDELALPMEWQLKLHREIMLKYFTHLTEMQAELKATLSKIAIDNSVIVLTVNKGQSELLINWVCSARSKGFDLKNAIIFPTDQFSKDVATGLDLATFYHEEVRHLEFSDRSLLKVIAQLYDYFSSSQKEYQMTKHLDTVTALLDT